MKPVLTVLPSRIWVGSSETLSAQRCQCPRCGQIVCLMWPERILHIQPHRIVYVDCPACLNLFSLMAKTLLHCLMPSRGSPKIEILKRHTMAAFLSGAEVPRQSRRLLPREIPYVKITYTFSKVRLEAARSEDSRHDSLSNPFDFRVAPAGNLLGRDRAAGAGAARGFF